MTWLIEYEGAKPIPVYIPEDFSLNHGNYTLDVWAARRFKTKVEAETWMARPTYITAQFQTIYCQPFGEPWAAIEHRFEGSL